MQNVHAIIWKQEKSINVIRYSFSPKYRSLFFLVLKRVTIDNDRRTSICILRIACESPKMDFRGFTINMYRRWSLNTISFVDTYCLCVTNARHIVIMIKTYNGKKTVNDIAHTGLPQFCPHPVRALALSFSFISTLRRVHAHRNNDHNRSRLLRQGLPSFRHWREYHIYITSCRTYRIYRVQL